MQKPKGCPGVRFILSSGQLKKKLKLPLKMNEKQDHNGGVLSFFAGCY